MPRGSIAHRSAAPSSGGSGGNSNVVVVPDAATLAAYNDGPLLDNTPAWVASFDDGFTLRRASVAVPDGILVVATLSGGGVWERNQIPAYHWMTQADWFIDAGAGNDEADGNTALTPVKTHAEIRRRVGPIPIADLDITWMVNSAEDVFFDWEGEAFVYEHGTTTNLFSGVITAAPQNWSGPLRNDAQITSATLPVSWTASGLVHRFGVLTSGASSGMSFFVAQDLGAKKARASIPCDVPGFSFAEGAFALNNAYTIFEVPTLSGYCTFSTRLRPGFFSVQNLRLGGTGLTSQNEIDLGVPFLLNCICNGTAVISGGNIQAIGCYFTASSISAGANIDMQATCIEDVLTIRGGSASAESSFVQNSVGYGIVGTSCRFKVSGTFFGHIASSSGALFSQGCDVLSGNGFYWFGRTVANVGINLAGNANCGFDRNARPDFGAVGVSQSYVGGDPKTFAEWPYQNTIAAAAAYFNDGDIPLDDFLALTADQTTNSAAFVDLPTMTDTFTILGSRRVDIDFTIQVAADVAAQAAFQLVFDGGATTMRGAAAANVGPNNVKLSFRISMNSGGHTVKVQWKNVGAAGFIYCRPVANPDLESASLRIRQALV